MSEPADDDDNAVVNTFPSRPARRKPKPQALAVAPDGDAWDDTLLMRAYDEAVRGPPNPSQSRAPGTEVPQQPPPAPPQQPPRPGDPRSEPSPPAKRARTRSGSAASCASIPPALRALLDAQYRAGFDAGYALAKYQLESQD
jgi:hypothetical protein